MARELCYLDKVASRIAEHCDMNFHASTEERRLLRLYALLCLSKGEDTRREDVHDAWSTWKLETDPDHRSLVPFRSLSLEVQRYDEPYCTAIHRVARALEDTAAHQEGE